MAFEPVFQTFKLDSQKRVCSQAVVEARLLPPSGVAIASVLSEVSDCVASVSEVFTGEARYSGRVNFKVLFVDSDSHNHCLDYNADFSDKIAAEELTSSSKPIIIAKIIDTDTVSVSESEIKLACVVEITMIFSVCEPTAMLMNGGENVYTHDDRLEYNRLIAECGECFEVTDSLNDVKASNLLLSQARIVVTRKTANLDSILVEGNIICDLVCETEGDMIMSYQRVTPFSREISAFGTRADYFVFAVATLNTCKAEIISDGEIFNAKMDYTICIKAAVFMEDMCNPIVDAFCITNELLSAGQSVKVKRNKICPSFNDRVEGSVTLDINMPIVDNILAVTSLKLNVTSAIARNGKITFEGVASGDVLYYSAEHNSKNSVAVELPFCITVSANVKEGDECAASGTVTNVTAKIRRGNEIDIKADITIDVSISENAVKYVITELKMGEERALPTGAFSIHIAKADETLWQVAKALSSTPENILLQNPELTLPLVGGERIICYRHLK